MGERKRSRRAPPSPHPQAFGSASFQGSTRAFMNYSHAFMGLAMCYPCAKALDSTDVCNTFFVSKGLVQLVRQCQLRLLVL